MHLSLVTVGLHEGHEMTPDCHSFWQDFEALLFADDQSDARAILTQLTYKVSRKPKNLLFHLRRIYCCYQHSFTLQLYAAILDLLIVLNGKGQPLSQRIIAGCRSRLDQELFGALKVSYKFPERLPSNGFSLFSPGTVGTLSLVDYAHHDLIEHDFLQLAEDFIEYSQLDEAMEILEQGLQVEPEREDAQSILLQLYRSTDNQDRFYKQHQLLLNSSAPLIEGWLVLKQYFDGKPT